MQSCGYVLIRAWSNSGGIKEKLRSYYGEIGNHCGAVPQKIIRW